MKLRTNGRGQYRKIDAETFLNSLYGNRTKSIITLSPENESYLLQELWYQILWHFAGKPYNCDWTLYKFRGNNEGTHQPPVSISTRQEDQLKLISVTYLICNQLIVHIENSNNKNIHEHGRFGTHFRTRWPRRSPCGILLAGIFVYRESKWRVNTDRNYCLLLKYPSKCAFLTIIWQL